MASGGRDRHLFILEEVQEYIKVILDTVTQDEVDLNESFEAISITSNNLLDKIEVFLSSSVSFEPDELKDSCHDLMSQLDTFCQQLSELEDDHQTSIKGIQKLLIRKKMAFSSFVTDLDKKCPTVRKVFHPFIPPGEAKRFVCEICGEGYDAFRSLKRHHRDHHKDNPFKCDQTESKGTCLLASKADRNKICGKKFTTDQICRHLKTHKVEIPANKDLRGFEYDGSTYSVVFCGKGEQLPEYDALVDDEANEVDRAEDLGQQFEEEVNISDSAPHVDVADDHRDNDDHKEPDNDYVETEVFVEHSDHEDVGENSLEENAVNLDVETGPPDENANLEVSQKEVVEENEDETETTVASPLNQARVQNQQDYHDIDLLEANTDLVQTGNPSTDNSHENLDIAEPSPSLTDVGPPNDEGVDIFVVPAQEQSIEEEIVHTQILVDGAGTYQVVQDETGECEQTDPQDYFEVLAQDHHLTQSDIFPSEDLSTLSPEKPKETPVIPTVTLPSDNVDLMLSVLHDSMEVDSDYEPGDSKEYTEARMARKKLRHLERDALMKPKPADNPVNKEVIDLFKEHMRKKTIKTKNRDNSGIDKKVSHLFLYPDSMLNFEVSLNERFNLKRNLSFSSSEFLEVKPPMEWIESTSGKIEDEGRRASRSIEQLKAAKSWRLFIKDQIEYHAFGGTVEEMLKKRLISDGIDKIDNLVKDYKLFSQYHAVLNRDAVDVQAAKAIVKPSNSYLETEAVKVWNSSDEARKETSKFDQMYHKSIKDKKIGDKNFSSFGQWTKFNLIKADKQRGGTYDFLNSNYWSKSKLYLPPNYTDFNNLPDGWDVNIPPSDGASPSMWQIRISGGQVGIKGQVATVINLTPSVYELCERYREIKEVKGLKEAADGHFFVNSHNKKLSGNYSTPGSIWKKFQQVTGIESSNPTAIRRGAEKTIQSQQKMKDQVLELNKHSQAVAVAHYHKTANISNAEFVNLNAIQEMEASASDVVQPSDENMMAKRKRRVEDDEKRSREEAEEFLNSRRKQNPRLSKRCKVLPDHRLYLQTLMNKDSNKEHFMFNKFPNDSDWKIKFNRFIDGCEFESEESTQLKKIQLAIFQNLKEEIVSESGKEWSGSTEQNSLADTKIAISVKKSFKSYELNKKSGSQKYFKF